MTWNPKHRPPMFIFSDNWFPDSRVKDSTRIVFALSLRGKAKNARVVFHVIGPPMKFSNGSFSPSSLSKQEAMAIWDTYKKQIENAFLDYCKQYEREYHMESWSPYSYLLLKPIDCF